MHCLLIDDMADAKELTRLVGVLEERVGNHIKFFWAAVFAGLLGIWYIVSQVSDIRTDMGVIKGQLKIASATSTLQAAVISADSTAPKALKEAREAISLAKKESTHVDPALPLRVADRAIRFASTQNDATVKTVAWQTVQDAVNYASTEASPDLSKRELSDCIQGTGPPNGLFGLFEATPDLPSSSERI